MRTESQNNARDKWDKLNMAYQTVKVKKELLEAFRAACAERGEKVNTVLREAMEKYVNGEVATDTEGKSAGNDKTVTTDTSPLTEDALTKALQHIAGTGEDVQDFLSRAVDDCIIRDQRLAALTASKK